MKKMNFVITLVLLVVLISSIGFSDSKVGDKINDVLYTDIITEINGQEVESFNINGSTAIYVTEAKKLGYKVNWDGDNRLVTIINDEAINPSYIENKLSMSENTNHQIGDKINDVLYTDIQTNINGNKVESFNINGSTAIFVTAFKEIPGVTVTWNSDQRRVVVSSESVEAVEEIVEEAINGDEERKEINGLELVEKNGISYLPNVEEPFTGTAIYYYDDGQIKGKDNYIDGKLNGKTIWYFDNKQVDAIGHYIDGKLHGEVIWYYENGQVNEIRNLEKGERHGVNIRYNEDGQIISEENYKYDKLHGEAIYYNNGEYMNKYHYKDGEFHGEIISYYGNGQISVKSNYEDGQKHGEYIEYDKNGDVKFIVNYKNGEYIEE